MLNKNIFHTICCGNKSWRRISDIVNERALEYAKKHNADFVFCGHTHRATNVAKDGVQYFNTGCWNDRYCHYVLIEDYCVSLKKFDKPIKSERSNVPRLRFRHAV